MTAMSVNGDMRKPVEIDIDEESSNFDITEMGIKYDSSWKKDIINSLYCVPSAQIGLPITAQRFALDPSE